MPPGRHRGGEKFAQFARIGACATRNRDFPTKKFSAAIYSFPDVRDACRRCPRTRCVERAPEMRARKNNLKSALFLFRVSLREARRAPRRRRRRGHGGHAHGRSAEAAAKIFFAGLLTPEKTVIRFRPNRKRMRAQEGWTIATKRTTKRPSARTLVKQYAGFVSPAESANKRPSTPNESHDDTRAGSGAGVFVCVGGTVFGASVQSAPTRLARRRLPAGPIPVAFC